MPKSAKARVRALDECLFGSLKEGGRLFELAEAVRSDTSLCLELRGKYFNVYYRGGNLMKVKKTGDGFSFTFDRKYLKASPETTPPNRYDGVDAWLDASHELKRAMDRWLGTIRQKDEREFQQILLRDNNFGTVAKSTDYYICDIEYHSDYGKFDLIGVHWPSTSSDRRRPDCRRLVFIEMKYGDGALKGRAGLHEHITGVNSYLSDPARVDDLKQDMVGVFNQKRELGFIDCDKDLGSFSDKPPILLLVFANHDPGVPKLDELLRCCPQSPHAELCVATASFMGYGLYDQGIHRIDEARRRFADYFYSRRSKRPKFGDLAREHQGNFRDSSDTISLEGRSPSDDIGICHRRLLALGSEIDNLYPSIRKDGGAIQFFKDRDIEWWQSSKSGDDTKVEGPTRNMASSQIACVNFFLPLVEIPGALLAVLRRIDDDVRGIVDIDHRGNRSPVEFEWIGLDRSLEGRDKRGAYNTSIDALLVAETEAGRKRAYLVEWKYVEESGGEWKKLREGQREEYSHWYYADASSFRPDAAPEMDDFLRDPFYQIMRQRLLADRMIADRELGVTEAKVVVVVPADNVAYREKITSPPLKERFPEAKTVAGTMKSVLKRPEEQFAMVTPAELVCSVEASCGESVRQWVSYWRSRYGV